MCDVSCDEEVVVGDLGAMEDLSFALAAALKQSTEYRGKGKIIPTSTIPASHKVLER